eukprot:g154.t1
MLTMLALLVQAALIASNISVARLSFLGRDNAPYDFPLLLGLVEISKLGISTIGAGLALLRKTPQNTNARAVSTDEESRVDTNPIWLYLIPGVLYPLSNSVDFLVVGVVTPGELSLLWNLKIASTAVLYRVLLKRSLHVVQWVALGTLLFGVVLVEYAVLESRDSTALAPASPAPAISSNQSIGGTDNVSPAATVSDITTSQRTLALLIVLVGTIIASFASVATEWIFKRSREIIWRQNAKLYFFGVVIFYLTVIMEAWIQSEGSDIDVSAASSGNKSLAGTVPSPSFSVYAPEGDGPTQWFDFDGWNRFCVVLLVLKSSHGLFTSFLLKYFDVILTVHADALATVLNVVASAMLWGLRVNFLFIFGAALTLVSILVYHHNGNRKGTRSASCAQQELPSIGSDEYDDDSGSDASLDSDVSIDVEEAEETAFLRK